MKPYRVQIFVALLVVFFVIIVASFQSPKHEEGRPYHHLSRVGFRNPEDNDPGQPKIRHLLGFLLRAPWQWSKTPIIPENMQIPEAKAIKTFYQFKNTNSITWLGHATFLIRIDGKIILTDPFLTDRAGPWIFGPKRYTPPGISIKNLPPIDIILLSHNHYDSLDLKTIKVIPNKEAIKVIVPLYNAEFFENSGYHSIYELDWFQSIQMDKINFTAIPAIHFSSRGLFDRNRRLWAGYIIKSGKYKILYMCDSAYGEIYRQIGKRYGPFDLVIVDIGAYEPQNVMKFSHTTPEEAIKIARDLKAKTVLAMHWGTLILSEEPPFEAPARFRAAGKAAKFSDSNIWVMKIGETRALPS